MVLTEYECCYINEPLTCVEKHEDGLSANEEFGRKLDLYHRFYEQSKDLFLELEQFSDKYWAQVWYNAARVYYHRDDFQLSISHLWNSFERPC